MVKYRETLCDVQNILEFLRCKERTIKEISTELKIPIATTHRLLKNLFHIQWVKQMDTKTNKHGRSSKSYLALVKIEKFRDNGG